MGIIGLSKWVVVPLAVVVGFWLAVDFAVRWGGFINEAPFALILGNDFQFGDVTLNVRAAWKFEWAGDVSDSGNRWPIKIVGSQDWTASGIKQLLVYPHAVPKTVKSPGQEVYCFPGGSDREVCRRVRDGANGEVVKLFRPSYSFQGENEYQVGRADVYFNVSSGLCQLIFLNFATGLVSGRADIDCSARAIWPSLADTLEKSFAAFVVENV